MPKQLINLRLKDDNFENTYQFNIYKKSGNIINLKVGNSGTIDLEVKFFKLPNELIECRIFQRFRFEDQKLVYKQPITNLLNIWEHSFSTYIVDNNYNNKFIEISTTDDEGNINGQLKLRSSKTNTFSVEMSFVNPAKQQEQDSLYINLKQQEKAMTPIQMVNIKLINCRDKNFIRTFKVNAYADKTDIRFTVNKTGKVSLYVEFIKEANGLTYCRIFQVYAYGKQSLLYNYPITTYLNICLKSLYPFIQWTEGQVESDCLVTRGYAFLYDENTKSNIHGYDLENVTQLYMDIQVEYENQQIQEEADKLFIEVKQKEEYYKLHKTEIDTIKELAAAYDKLAKGE